MSAWATIVGASAFALTVLGFTGVARAGEPAGSDGTQPSAAEQADAGRPDPYLQPNGTWISIGGTVHDVTRDAFTLDYGDGLVRVLIKDRDRNAQAYTLDEGDRVTVNGLVDDEFFKATAIRAGSVYVDKLGTTFSANPLAGGAHVPVPTRMVVPSTTVQGEVTAVGPHEFTLDTGRRRLTIQTDRMPYDPLDDQGYQKIEVGDLVRVTAQMHSDLFTQRKLEADAIVKLERIQLSPQ